MASHKELHELESYFGSSLKQNIKSWLSVFFSDWFIGVVAHRLLAFIVAMVTENGHRIGAAQQKGKKVSEYYQETPQSYTTDQPIALCGTSIQKTFERQIIIEHNQRPTLNFKQTINNHNTRHIKRQILMDLKYSSLDGSFN